MQVKESCFSFSCCNILIDKLPRLLNTQNAVVFAKRVLNYYVAKPNYNTQHILKVKFSVQSCITCKNAFDFSK